MIESLLDSKIKNKGMRLCIELTLYSEALKCFPEWSAHPGGLLRLQDVLLFTIVIRL